MVQKTEARVAEAEMTLEELFEGLSASSRRQRQIASKAIAERARADCMSVVPFANRLLDSLECPEAQTRWECLSALSLVMDEDASVGRRAIDGAEFSLFDETNGPVRLAAFRFLCKVGSRCSEDSLAVWPLLDEALQCYHGDPEFMDMMSAIAAFAQTDIADEVRTGLIGRLSFDAANGRGAIRRRSKAILDSLGCE